MSESFVPFDPARDAMFGGGGGSKPSTPPANTTYRRDTSQLFEPYKQFLPAEMNSNQQITDPTAILKAYQANLPAFQQASMGTRVPVSGPPKQATPALQQQRQSK